MQSANDDKLRLEFNLSDLLLQFADYAVAHHADMTRSDLQGLAEAKAKSFLSTLDN